MVGGGGVDSRPRLTFLSLNEPPAAALDSRHRLCLRALRNTYVTVATRSCRSLGNSPPLADPGEPLSSSLARRASPESPRVSSATSHLFNPRYPFAKG